MAVMRTKPVQDLLKEWKEKGVNSEFFQYVGLLGRKPEEIKEMLYKPEKKAVSVTFEAKAEVYTELTHWR